MTGNPDQPPNDATPESAIGRLEHEWAAVVGDLQAHQRAWLQASKPVTLHGSTAIVAVPDDFTRKRLEGRLRGQLEDALTERFGHEVQLAVTVDSSLHHGNELGLDPRSIAWRRVLDVNDRALRNVVEGLGARIDGVPRQSGFDITAASEVMVVLGLSTSLRDLRERLGRIVVGFTYAGRPVTDKSYNITFNNFYEFGSSKQIYRAAEALPIRPWEIAFDGLIEKPFVIGIDDLLKKVTLEERACGRIEEDMVTAVGRPVPVDEEGPVGQARALVDQEDVAIAPVGERGIGRATHGQQGERRPAARPRRRPEARVGVSVAHGQPPRPW